jgi:hypothetical protein
MNSTSGGGECVCASVCECVSEWRLGSRTDLWRNDNGFLCVDTNFMPTNMRDTVFYVSRKEIISDGI